MGKANFVLEVRSERAQMDRLGLLVSKPLLDKTAL